MIYPFYIVLGFFIVEMCRLLMRKRMVSRHNRYAFFAVMMIESLWILAVLIAQSSHTEQEALFWFRISYVVLLPAPMGTQWLCFKIINETMPRGVIILAIAAILGVAVATFLTPWVVPVVHLNPFTITFGPLYSALSFLTLFHAAHGYFQAKRNLGHIVVFDKEVDFTNRFIGCVMIGISALGVVGGFLLPLLVAQNVLPPDFPFLMYGVGVVLIYYSMARFIFWRLNELAVDDPFERLSKRLIKLVQRFLVSKQLELRKSIEAVLDHADLERLLKGFSAVTECALLLEFGGREFKIYGNAPQFLRLHVSPEEWLSVTPQITPLVTSKLARSHPDLFKKMLDHGVGAIFPVLNALGECIGQLKFDLKFSHRFLYKQDYEVIFKFCDRLAALSTLSAPVALVSTLDPHAPEPSFSWIGWIKNQHLPVFGKPIYLYGSKAWQQRVSAVLEHYFVCESLNRPVEASHIINASDEGVIVSEDLSLQNALSIKGFSPRLAVMPQKMSDSDMVNFCAQCHLLQLGIVHHAPQLEGSILSLCPDLTALAQDLNKLAEHPDPPPVFLCGPTGVGKNLFIGMLHQQSKRKGQLISLNCAAIPEHLLESELFGHTKGAFTGAVQDKKGLFELAQGGTLFLDEIGDMPLGLQAKLLHVLQERKIQPVGSTAKIDLDVRIASASKYGIPEMRKRLRDDLFFRLVGISRTIAPLATRPMDIPLVINFCLLVDAYYTQDYWHSSDAWMQGKLSERWPGNVRELVQRVRSEMALATTPYILDSHAARKAKQDTEDISMPQTQATGEFHPLQVERHFEKTYKQFKRTVWVEHSRAYFYRLLSQAPNQQEAAKQAGLSPSRFSSLLKELGIRDFE